MAAAQDNTVIRTFKFRLLPTKKQRMALTVILESQRQLYNGALDHRIGAWKKARKQITLHMQQQELTVLRQEAEFAGLPLRIQRWTLKRLDYSFMRLFGRVRRGQRGGFPRFRNQDRWRSFGFDEFSGIRFDGDGVRFVGLPGRLRIHCHRRPPTGKPLACVFTRDAKGWCVCLQYRTGMTLSPTTGQDVGIDFGLKELCVLSDGKVIANLRHVRRNERMLRRRQRALSRCKRGSKRRSKMRSKVIRWHDHISNARRTYLHQVSARIVRDYDRICIEGLNVKGLARGILAKSVHDAGWSMLREFLMYKAESAGRELIAVDPRQTSQTCPDCGQVAKKKLSERIHRCDCGCVLDRDHAAALVILARGRSGSRVRQRKAFRPKRRTGNIGLAAETLPKF
jgi:putative transposase